MTERLDPEHFAHPLDLSARGRIDKIIGSRSWTKRFFEGAERKAERHAYIEHLANDTRLSSRQATSVYRHVEELAHRAGMKVPRVFLDTSPVINAFALGQHNPVVVLNSALVDQFTEAQLRAVIAHELGHIKCQHTFYMSVSRRFEPLAAMASSLPGGSLVALALQWHLKDWSRKAELSCDRFSLLVTEDLEVVQSMIIQLAGGGSSLGSELSTSAFREQANEFRKVSGHDSKPRTTMEKIEYYVTELILSPNLNTHPWPAIRFVELEDWSKSRQYALLREGNLDEAAKHPFQYLPDTFDDGELDPTELGESVAGPVLKQAAAEVAEKWKGWSSKLSGPATTGAHAGNLQHPPGWHPDANDPSILRWWNGTAWTDETRPS